MPGVLSGGMGISAQPRRPWVTTGYARPSSATLSVSGWRASSHTASVWPWAGGQGQNCTRASGPSLDSAGAAIVAAPTFNVFPAIIRSGLVMPLSAASSPAPMSNRPAIAASVSPG